MTSKDLQILILIDDVGAYIDESTMRTTDTNADIDDETVIIVIYRDLKEGQLYNTILMSLYMVFDNQLYIIETCKTVADALNHGYILSKSSFCG